MWPTLKSNNTTAEWIWRADSLLWLRKTSWKSLCCGKESQSKILKVTAEMARQQAAVAAWARKKWKEKTSESGETIGDSTESTKRRKEGGKKENFSMALQITPKGNQEEGLGANMFQVNSVSLRVRVTSTQGTVMEWRPATTVLLININHLDWLLKKEFPIEEQCKAQLLSVYIRHTQSEFTGLFHSDRGRGITWVLQYQMQQSHLEMHGGEGNTYNTEGFKSQWEMS